MINYCYLNIKCVTILLVTTTKPLITSAIFFIFFMCVCVGTRIINTFDFASPYDDEHDACNVMTTKTYDTHEPLQAMNNNQPTNNKTDYPSILPCNG